MSGSVLRVALFGHPLGHSRSRELFEALSAGGGPVVDYQPVDVPPGELPAVLDQLRQGRWDGANVTVPYKQAVQAALAQVTAAAREAGAVNVLRREADGALIGDNTDGAGFLEGLGWESGFDPWDGNRTPRVLILGGGGAARGVLAAMAARGAEVTLVTRRLAEVEPWTQAAGARALAWDDPGLGPATAAAELIVQATSLGMAPALTAQPPLALDAVDPERAVIVDLVYNPWETPLLAAARRRGIRSLNGWPMLVHQAARSLAFWIGSSSSFGGRLVAAARRLEPRSPAEPG